MERIEKVHDVPNAADKDIGVAPKMNVARVLESYISCVNTILLTTQGSLIYKMAKLSPAYSGSRFRVLWGLYIQG